MLPRNLIIEWRRFFEEALLVRYPPQGMYFSESAKEMILDLRQVELLGAQSLSLQKEIEVCRNMRNEISSRFPKASKEEKDVYKTLVVKCKEKINELEKQHSKIETQCRIHENRIPNVPDKTVPLWNGISEFNEKCIRTNLEFIHNLINEYNE